MAFTINHPLQQLPTYSRLCQLAEQHHFLVTGDEHAGSFSRDGVAGSYQFSKAGIQGNFAAHGVKGTYVLAGGQAAVTVEEKPFWLPETLLKQKIAEGLNTLWKLPC
jgi:hypothetical protein